MEIFNNRLKKSLGALSLACLSLFSNSYGQSNEPTLAWAKNVNMGNKYNNIRLASTTDKDGFVYVTCVAYEDLHLGINNLIFNKMGWQDAFVLKIDGSGQVVWSKQFAYNASNAQARGMSVDVDDDGNVYVAGQFSKTIDFNANGPTPQVVTSKGIWDAFVCKLDKDGNFTWVRTWGKPSGRDFAHQVKVGPNGTVYVTGTFSDSLDLNPGTGVQMAYATGAPSPTHPTNPVMERFICKLDASGNYLWSNHFEEGVILNAEENNSLGLAVDPSGNAYLAGVYRNSLSFPPASGVPPIAPVGETDIYLIKINNSGNILWTKGFGGPGSDKVADMKMDDQNNLYLVGGFNRTIDLDPNLGGKFFRNTGTSSYSDAYVLKINSDGEYIWATTFGSSNHDNALSVAIDQSHEVYVSGSFKDSVKFVTGSNDPKHNIVSNGTDYDIFVVKLDTAGKYVWSKSMGGASTQMAAGTGPDCGDEINVDPFGNIYMTGHFRATADFNQGSTPPVELSADDGNLFILKYGGMCDTTYANVEASNCGPYDFNGKTFETSGLYTEVLRNVGGCDSIVTLNLVINETPEPAITVNGFVLSTAQRYVTYQWLLNDALIPGATDSTYTVETNGSYRVIVTTSAGCMDTSEVYEITNYTGVSNHTKANKINIYPNPTNAKVFISAGEKIEFALYDMQGRRLASFEREDHIDLSAAAKGIYMIRITDLDGQLLKTEKVVKE